MSSESVLFDKRNTAISRVMRKVARMQMSAALPIVDELGVSPIVVALPDDLLTDIGGRISDAGGSANLFIAYPDVIRMAACSSTVASGDVAETHPDSTIDMVLGWIDATPDGVGTVRISNSFLPENGKIEELAYEF